MRELFHWRLMQTDPNFANVRYRSDEDEVVLLDFGATGRLPPPDMLYIHRKLGGLYLLLKRIGAKVPVSELIAPYLNRRQ